MLERLILKKNFLPKMDRNIKVAAILVRLETDTRKMNIIVYRYQNQNYPKDPQIELNLTKNQV